MPKVSVVIPTYNNAHYIGEALDSVLAQGFTDFEIVVVDDGSTDDTERVVAAYGGRIRYHWQANGGLAVARNTGMRLSRGEFLTYLDADDVWERDNLRFKVALLDQHPDLGGVFSEFAIFDDQGTRHAFGTRHMFPFFARTGRGLDDVLQAPRSATLSDGHIIQASTGFAFDDLFWGNFILPTSMVFRIAFAREVGEFRPELRTQQDYEYWLRFSKRYALAHLNQPLVRYRRHADQLTDHSRIENILIAVEGIIGRYREEFDDTGRGREYRRRQAGVQLELSKVYLGQGRSKEARRRLRATIALAPGLLPAYAVFAASLVPRQWLSPLKGRKKPG